MLHQFKLISLSHKTASVAVRELIALNEDEAKQLLVKIQEFFNVSEALVVSTCNRTELYYLSENSLSIELIKLLASQKGILAQTIQEHFEVIDEGENAIKHLFEVCTGLHSQVVGDMQIPNQVKQAYQWAADTNLAGPFLHRLMHTIFFTNKKVAQETTFRDGAASTSYAAVELIEEFLTTQLNPRVLVLGLGEIGVDVCKNLVDKEYKNIILCNRTRSKAEKLAGELNLEFVDFNEAETEILKADVVISSLATQQVFIDSNTLAGHQGLTFKYFIDLSVPRSIDKNIEKLAGVVLYNIDEIQSRANLALQKRLDAIPEVEKIIAESIVDFNNWNKEMIVSPTIQKLKNALEQIRKEELARYLKGVDEKEAELIEKITTSMMQKFIKLPVLNLKAACKRGDADNLIDVMNDLFNLENTEKVK